MGMPQLDTSSEKVGSGKRDHTTVSDCFSWCGASPTRGSSARPPLLRRAVASVPSLFCRGVVTALFYGPRFESFQIFDWTPFPGILQGAATPASNSIRHNLSLHNRFMRVQNEGTGKSSWWMINPDAKPGKSVRRRAASMETSKFEKRRGRVKKKVELMRNGALPDTTPSPSSSVSESLDLFPESPIHSGAGFQLSPDFRPRASSNTSSCGRLSPIPAVVGVEPDWSSPSQYNSTNYSPEMPGNYSPDQLAGNLEQGMKLQPDAYLGYINGQTPQQPPPPYTAPYEQFPGRREINSLHATSPYGLSQCPIHRIHSCSCMQVQCKVESMSPAGMSPSYPHSEPSPDPLSSQYMINRSTMPRPPSSSPPLTPQPTQGTPSTMMGQLMGALNSSTVLDDLNINVESFQGGFDCNVEELIKHELSMEGSLDFNFPNQQQSVVPQPETISGITANQANAPPPYSTTVTTPSWVH
ncbi:hypothetical protein GEV33_010118 [Tenebrio molitor]|uniref:Fork-head domain-containing protein n=1 Tax=Tenebrio molitor TaxID=7067 RepID=A0A8J6HFF6_TENMO|nr:hypothetical protein GEV33_010118 [Tenebrio molitor]